MMDMLNSTPSSSIAIIIFFTVLFFFKFISSPIRRRRKRKTNLVKHFRTSDEMKEMSWENFERLCGEIFSARGWKVKNNDSMIKDGGVDIWLKRGSNRAIVQCKRYSTTRVGVKTIREFYGVMMDLDIDRGYVVTTSRFTKDAHAFAKGKQITLIDGLAIEKMIAELK